MTNIRVGLPEVTLHTHESGPVRARGLSFHFLLFYRTYCRRCIGDVTFRLAPANFFLHGQHSRLGSLLLGFSIHAHVFWLFWHLAVAAAIHCGVSVVD
jgi:hypothetical protein